MSAMNHIDDHHIRYSFTSWVINGDNAPEFGDELFDRIFAKDNNLQINKYFMYETYEDGKYKNCILRKKVPDHELYQSVECITFDPHQLILKINYQDIYL
jgi:hypothetical protein